MKRLSPTLVRVLSAIADGPPASERNNSKGVRLETIAGRTGLTAAVCAASIRTLKSKKTGAYIKQVPGTSRSPRWTLDRETAEVLPHDQEAASLLHGAFELRNIKNDRVQISDLVERFANDYGEARVRAIIEAMAKRGYYLQPDRIPGYFIVKVENYRYDRYYIALRQGGGK